jgi:hypothetical protein
LKFSDKIVKDLPWDVLPHSSQSNQNAIWRCEWHCHLSWCHSSDSDSSSFPATCKGIFSL